MEEKKEPLAPRPAPDGEGDRAEATVPAAAPAEKPVDSGAPAAAPAAPAEPAVEPAAAPKSAPVAAPTQPAEDVAAPISASAEKPAELSAAAPVAAPQPAPATPPAPAAPKAAPAAAPMPPAAAPVPSPVQPVGEPAPGTVPMPVQPGVSANGPIPMQPQPIPAGSYPPPPMPGYAHKSGKAVGALVCGILAIVAALVVPVIGPIIGIILGIAAIVLASKAVREAGRDGKATGGKVCGIIGIVASVLVGIVYIAATVGVYSALTSYDYDELSSDYTPPASIDSSSASTFSAEEQVIADEVTALLDKAAVKDPAFIQELTQEFEEDSAESLGMAWSEMGADPAVLADWATTDFQYEVSSVYIKEDTATAYVDTTEHDVLGFMILFSEKLNEYQKSGAADSASGADVKAKIGEIFNEAMVETTEATTYCAAIDFNLVNGEWVVDEDSLEEEFDYMFGTF
ncbi:MAG: DUF4190 domain-containing protein [Slackia sp.]|nr:DUF4190 domain-containing protein [Slackia sp.]